MVNKMEFGTKTVIVLKQKGKFRFLKFLFWKKVSNLSFLKYFIFVHHARKAKFDTPNNKKKNKKDNAFFNIKFLQFGSTSLVVEKEVKNFPRKRS